MQNTQEYIVSQINAKRLTEYRSIKYPALNEKNELTEKQTLVYLYLIGLSHYTDKTRMPEDHYYVYKENINDNEAATFLGINRKTYTAAVTKLIELGYITYSPKSRKGVQKRFSSDDLYAIKNNFEDV